MKPDDLGALLHYAMRYAMGRYTYAVNDVTRLIRAHWRDITDNDRSQLLADLDANVYRHERDGKTLGADYVARLWIELRAWMVAAQKETP